MTLFSQELRCKPGRAEASAPTGGYKGYGRRADVGIGPYGGLQGVRWTAQWLSGGGLGQPALRIYVAGVNGRGRAPPLRITFGPM